MMHETQMSATHAGGVRWRSMMGAGIFALVASGCGNDSMGFIPSQSSSAFYAELQFPVRAYNIGTDQGYNTVQLNPHGLFGDGSFVPGTIEFATDNENITVSSTGLVTAVNPTLAGPAIVRASLKYGEVTHTDSALIQVTSGHPAVALQRISIQPLPGDSAKIDARGAFTDGVKQLTLTATDAHGDPFPDLLVDYVSSDSLTASVGQDGVVIGLRPGTLTMYVRTYAYGVIKEDSLPFTVGQSIGAFVTITKRTITGQRDATVALNPGTINIGVGGSVGWFNQTDLAMNVIFDDSLHVDASNLGPNFDLFNGYPGPGNIRNFVVRSDETGPVFNTQFAIRSFTRPGQFTYHIEPFGVSGVVAVCDERVALCGQ